MIETVIVGAVVLLAAIGVIYSLYRDASGKGGCAGCSGCDINRQKHADRGSGHGRKAS